MTVLLRSALLRRLLTVPLVFVLLAVGLAVLPLLLLGSAAAAPWLPGRWRALRLVLFGVVYFTAECLGLLACAALWVAAGCGLWSTAGWYRRAHLALLRTLLEVLVGTAARCFRLRVRIEEPDGERPDRPLLVLSRHAGPGDSFILEHVLLNRYRLSPRNVVKATLQLDPLIDMLLSRTPNAFIAPQPGVDTEILAAITRLTTGLRSGESVLIFPEGGNFTAARRERSIAKLVELGEPARAEIARRLRYVLAPRPAGTLAALAANPDLDVVFVAHTGLEHMGTVRQVWQHLPLREPIVLRWWRVPAAQIPADEPARVAWLDDWWLRIDRWVSVRMPYPDEAGGAELPAIDLPAVAASPTVPHDGGER